MREAASFGIIPVRRVNGGFELFLVCHRSGGWWGFPKGHAEEGESERAAAERELFEETRLTPVHYLASHPIVEEYRFVRYGETIKKRVTYFIAEVEGEAEIQAEELEGGEWLSLEEAAEVITYPEGVAVYDTVREILLRGKK